MRRAIKKVTALSSVIAVMLLAVAVKAHAQQPTKIRRVAYLAGVSPSADAPRLEAFPQALRAYGYIEGQNILIETRHESNRRQGTESKNGGFQPIHGH